MDLQQINLSGHIATIASTTNGSLLVAQLRPQNPQNEADMLIQAFDTSLKLVWQQVKLSYATHAIKIVDDIIWFNSGYILEQLTLEGETVAIIEPQLLPNEWIADYIIQRELIFVCTVKRFARTIEDKRFHEYYALIKLARCYGLQIYRYLFQIPLKCVLGNGVQITITKRCYCQAIVC